MQVGADNFVMNICAVLWISLFGSLLVLPVVVLATCDGSGACAGERSRSAEGCCPLLPGNSCGAGIEAKCDGALGFSCEEGQCKGSYNLSLSDVGTTVATLSWLAFLSEGSRFEYSVLYSQNLAQPLAHWSSHGVGDVTRVTLRHLTPATLYYVRVGVWTEEQYDNLTEVLFLYTKAETHCSYNGRRLALGERLVVECQESCVCRATGRFRCEPVCRQGDTETPICGDDGQTEGCCDSVPHCLFNNCTYLGDNIAHAHTWTIDCQENCTCYDGFVTCTPLCDDSRKPDCAGAVVATSGDECCGSWKCESSEDTCSFRNSTFTEGTWFYDECQLCTCDTSTGGVECLDLAACDTPEVPETSEECRSPTIINNLCCSQVYCEQNKDLDDLLEVFSVTSLHPSAVIVRFKLTSPTNVNDVNSVVLAFSKQTDRTSIPVWENVTFSLHDVEDISNKSVEFAEFRRHTAVYSAHDDFLTVVSGLDHGAFYYFKLQMEFTSAPESNDSRSRSTQVLSTNMVVLKIHGLPIKHPGHSHGNNESGAIFHAVNVTAFSAAVTWRLPPPDGAAHGSRDNVNVNVSWFVVRYKPLSERGWRDTERLIFSETRVTLPCLYDSRWYQAELVAYPGTRKLGTTFFNTSDITESTDSRFMVKFKRVEPGTNMVKLNWEPVDDKHTSEVSTLEIVWSGAEEEDTVYKICVPPDTSQLSIDNLVPGKLYRCWIRLNLISGKTVFSSQVHFLTQTPVSSSSHSSSSHRHSIVLAVTVTSVSVISIVVAIATVAYLTRCRRRASYHSQTSFENKIFQIYKEDREV